jgi:hypothetical protein
MSQRKWTLLVGAIILVAIGTELAVRHWSSARGCVQIDNAGDGPMDDLVVSYENTKVELGQLAVGQSTKAWFTAGRRGILTLEFKQRDNPLKGFQVEDFDPVENRRTGSKLVLVVKSGRVERFVEADENSPGVDNLLDRIKEWIQR